MQQTNVYVQILNSAEISALIKYFYLFEHSLMQDHTVVNNVELQYYRQQTNIYI